MRFFSYRKKRAAKRVLWTLGITAALFLIFYIGRFVFLQRYITYTADGAQLNYDQHITMSGEDPVVRDPAEFPFETVIDPDAEFSNDEPLSTRLHGYYISSAMLADGVSGVREALRENDDYNALIIDVKSKFGNYYYSTKQPDAPLATAAKIEDVDLLIRELTQTKKLTVIARFPAFVDRNYALEHHSQSLPLYNGALWEGDDMCYWLNPYSNDVQGYLASVAMELADLGFDEVLFDDFYFPDSDRIAWDDTVTRKEAVVDAAVGVVDNLYGIEIGAIFGSSDPDVAAKAGRVCITTDDAGDVDDIV
ncbi:MAG: hypothetical protein IIV87_01060, partial [Oscillospiraceae bacterium]|nr:hypothetical protein [Oscillospiraceae bacterium]